MLKDGKIWMAQNDQGEDMFILPKMANRHGLVAGATGTGKTVTLKVMAEAFSDMGVPVFMADVKGDIAGMLCPGTDTPDMQKRIEKFGLAAAGFEYKGCPVTLWDIFGKNGIQLRTTISEIGPVLLARILDLNDLQSALLSIIFKIADDNGLLLIDTKDIKACVNYIQDHRAEFEADYGKMSPASLSAITRAIVAMELAGGDVFFGEPALNINDWLAQDMGRGMINILDSESLINNGKLYSTFLLWMLSELFERLPEVGDLAKPKMVFFFDEAHLLFDGASKTLLDKIEQVVKLIRSKGVGVYFCTQNPRDIPDGVLAQLGNKVQHGLRAYTPAEQKAIKAAAASFRENPAFNAVEVITSLGTGKALISFLGEDGVPGMAQKVSILPPQCSMGGITEGQRDNAIKGSLLYGKYAESYDPDSAYEFLMRQGQEEAAAKEQAKAEAARAKEEERLAKEQAKEDERLAKAQAREEARLAREEAKLQEKLAKEAEKQALAEEKAKQKVIKSVGTSVLGTVGRAVGKTVGDSVGGTFGKSLGGNLGASLARGLFGTLFKG
ncbi:MAG: DUF853 family protein [Schwartzia sp.]|nr:DUF853 family protein [Schwartzia sp. (in: firmicutes)]